MVMTPRPRRSAEVFAPSLLTITAGRRLFASAPRAGSRSTRQISPRRISQYRRRSWHPRVLHPRLATTLPTQPRSRAQALRPEGGAPPFAARLISTQYLLEKPRRHRGTPHPPQEDSHSPSYSHPTKSSIVVAR